MIRGLNLPCSGLLETMHTDNHKNLTNKDIKIPELLAPAGNFDKMVSAIHYGADAVYLGGKNYSLRARAKNFGRDEIEKAIRYAHDHKTRVYITVNIFAHNRDFQEMKDYLFFLKNAGADALIISDPGILSMAMNTTPDIPIHLSTQANVTNMYSAVFWEQQGVKRINIARELGFNEIKEIRMATKAEIEVFVHGALCISYSGRCMLSNYLTGRDANRGDCAHPCRYSYKLVEQKRPGEYFPVEEDGRGTYIFNSRDLCLINRLPDIISAGIDSIKIEGRMKSVGYTGNTVRIYRAALDWIKMQLEQGTAINRIVMPKEFEMEIDKTSTRGYTENFFHSPPTSEDMMYNTTHTEQKFVPVAIVRGINPLLLEIRNPLNAGDKIEYLGHQILPVVCTVTEMFTEDKTPVKRANPGNRVIIHTDPELVPAEINSIIQKRIR